MPTKSTVCCTSAATHLPRGLRILDAAGSQRAAILTAGDSSDLALVFAATYPGRVPALVIWAGHFRGTWAPDYPWAPPREEALREIGESERRWPASLLETLQVAAPSLVTWAGGQVRGPRSIPVVFP